MVTIKDVALLAGVSASTVSRAITGDVQVNEPTRLRVQEAISALGYRPNRIARNLRRQRSETIGVVVSDIENPHFTRAVRAIEDAAYRQGYRVILCNTDETLEKQQAYLEVLAAEQVVGVILVPADAADPTVSELLDMKIPVVAFDRRVDDDRADAVFADNRDAAKVATTHLIASGRRHVAFISGRANIQTGAERLHGYEEVMSLHGMDAIVGVGDFRQDTARLAMLRLLDQHPDIGGVVVANNLMVIGVLEALRFRDVTVPGDIALVGIDEPAWASLVQPALTTLGQPTQQMANRAFELLIERISGKREATRFEVFHFQLHVRDSCGRRQFDLSH
ncbi:MAG: LacI family DNA-binding transcriptional regulator [Thermomicrobiales bacterium]